MSKLAIDKAARYRELKARIQGGISKRADIELSLGEWLAEIKRDELYKHDTEKPCGTWKEFCERVQGFSRRKGDQTIQAAAIRQALTDAFAAVGSTPPMLADRAANELADTEPAEAVEIIKAATSNGGRPTVVGIKNAKRKNPEPIDTAKRAKARVVGTEPNLPMLPPAGPDDEPILDDGPKCCPTCKRPLP